jgi:hypothetical protein
MFHKHASDLYLSFAALIKGEASLMHTNHKDSVISNMKGLALHNNQTGPLNICTTQIFINHMSQLYLITRLAMYCSKM